MNVDEAGRGIDSQVVQAARIIQEVRPEVLVLNEIDHDYDSRGQGLVLNARRFIDNYLNRGESAIDYPFVFAAPCNTGVLSGLDLNGDGAIATEADRGDRRFGDDSWGFGVYPGQYSMAILSKHPILEGEVRTFQKFLWKDLPGNHIPYDYYSAQVAEKLRLSSKSHWDVPISVNGRTLHLWVSHPTPPGFDGEEDRNGRRNFDEIRFWQLYLQGDTSLYDDAGVSGGYGSASPFLIAGDLNASPDNPELVYDEISAINQLLDQPEIRDTGVYCVSGGALQERTPGPPDFVERNTITWRGGARIDYLLPSQEITVVDGGVYWPAPDIDPEGYQRAEEASDHRMVWIDFRM